VAPITAVVIVSPFGKPDQLEDVRSRMVARVRFRKPLGTASAPAAGQCSAAWRYRGVAPQPGTGLPTRTTCALLWTASGRGCHPSAGARQAARRSP
jgi:hypothetical protein